ncbi:MAG: glycosyltransferase family 2 protein [Candidatus Omnitrophica bacterium]|nr:glycosyltransferase family 2 protein [Candidatus Omnitrophota bacterium]
MRYPKVSIVMLCWNNVDEVLGFLQYIIQIDYPRYDIIVVDNGSTTGNVQKIEDAYPQIHVIHNATNLGWGGGNNVALEYVFKKGSDYAWIVNTDARLEPETLIRLVNAAQANDQVGMVSPVIYFLGKKDRIQNCGSTVDWKKFTLKDFCSLEDVQKADKTKLLLWGTSLLIKRSVFETIGCFDSNVFVYTEDIDYSCRSNTAGFLNVIVPEARIYHESHSVDIGGEKCQPIHWFFYISRNEYYFWMKYLKGFSRIIFFRHYFLLIMERVIRYHNDDSMRQNVHAALDGYYCGVKELSGEWKDDIHMPAYLKKFLLKHPCFIYDLFSGRILVILTQLVKKAKNKLLRMQT